MVACTITILSVYEIQFVLQSIALQNIVLVQTLEIIVNKIYWLERDNYVITWLSGTGQW